MAENRLQVTELDFDTIKSNLKSFLRQQTQFQDYDFEGSALSVLVDLLAYNTHYNAYYLNMVANEAFLDTALLRDSVVSHAKTLGYTPYSVTAPSATLNVTITSASSNTGELTIPRGYIFLSNQIDNRSYDFVVMQDTTVTKSNQQYFFEDLVVREGELVTYNFTYNQSSNPKSIFELPDADVDISTVTVSVRPSASNTDSSTFIRSTEIVNVGPTSEVFFLQETRNLKYQVYYGNDIIGKKLPDGAIVSVTYLLTGAETSNKATFFSASGSITDSLGELFTLITVQTVLNASGGSQRESIDEIKYSAPLQFATQNRLVTKTDYESYIRRNYPSVDSLSVWGGEDEDPPVYGKVFISLKPKENFFISETEKQRIIDEIIKPNAILSVSTEIRDPEFLFILLNSTVTYDPRKITITETALKSQIRNAILGYKTTNLDKFDSIFSASKLQDTVDNVNLKAILGTETSVRLQKRFTPSLGLRSNYTIDFDTPLIRGTLTDKLESTSFSTPDASGTTRTAFIEEVPQSFTGISEIQITNAGYGYISVPTVTISGDGVGATATAIIDQGRVTSIQINNRGFDYSRATVTISGGGGFSATATVRIDSSVGTLRTIYFDANANRQVINSSVGEINYLTGRITIRDINIIAVSTTDILVRLTVGSEEGIIESTRSTIVTIDETDPASIVTGLVRSTI
jgi:hypothetical protein